MQMSMNVGNDENIAPGNVDLPRPPKVHLTKEQKRHFNKLVLEARNAEQDGQDEAALDAYLRAQAIFAQHKIEKKIIKLQNRLHATEDPDDDDVGHIEDESRGEEPKSSFSPVRAAAIPKVQCVTSSKEDESVSLGRGYRIPRNIYDRLYEYQKEGVKWLWERYCNNGRISSGGILGDDMGLGKTVQVSTFIAGLFHSEVARQVLVVAPVAVLESWRKHLEKWTEYRVHVEVIHGDTPARRRRKLKTLALRGGVCVTTYGLITSSAEVFGDSALVPMWDCVVLDEGHRIKNAHIKLSKRMREVPTLRRFLLTGTPIQNNLQELWSLFDYVCQGKLLGAAPTFKELFSDIIERGSERDATPEEREQAAEQSRELRAMIAPYFLRREKKSVLKNNDQCSKLNVRKNDLVVWIRMTRPQLNVYRDFLESERVQELLNSSKSPLAAISVLKKVCDHPALLLPPAKYDSHLSLIRKESQRCDGELTPKLRSFMCQSGKLLFLDKLLRDMFAEGHRTLIFSQSKKMINSVELILHAYGYTFLRMDGSVTSSVVRQEMVDEFNRDSSIFCFLMTTQVGGLGLTLTGASRGIIIDPAWNGSIDDQAVDRVYRLGQTKDVIFYRLITCGTVEEKIYRKQVFKTALMKTAVEKGNQYRYFTHTELRELFKLENPKRSKTQLQLSTLHETDRETDPALEQHIDALVAKMGSFGISDHNLLYSVDDDHSQSDGASQTGKTPRRRRPQAMSVSTGGRGRKSKASGATASDDDDVDTEDGGDGQVEGMDKERIAKAVEDLILQSMADQATSMEDSSSGWTEEAVLLSDDDEDDYTGDGDDDSNTLGGSCGGSEREASTGVHACSDATLAIEKEFSRLGITSPDERRDASPSPSPMASSPVVIDDADEEFFSADEGNGPDFDMSFDAGGTLQTTMQSVDDTAHELSGPCGEADGAVDRLLEQLSTTGGTRIKQCLSPDSFAEYNRLLLRARTLEEENDNRSAFNLYLQALSVNDDDNVLHARVLTMASQFGML